MAPYDYQGLQKWKTLTDDINHEVITRANPENGVIRPSAEFQSCTDEQRPKGKSPLTSKTILKSGQCEEDLLPNLPVVPGTAPRFTKIPALCPLTATPAEISQSHLDSVVAVEKLFDCFQTPIDLIPEIQFAYILYLAGCSIDALAHWRKLLGLLSKSEKSVEKYRSFYRRYLEVLQHQLPELPEELMPPSQNNTVFKDIRSLIVNCSVGGLKHEADGLCASLTQSMMWHFHDIFEEDPEDMPVIVET